MRGIHLARSSLVRDVKVRPRRKLDCMRAAHRAHLRRSRGGFTLLELMVVVLLVAILTALAMPSMSVARDDRLTFNYAQQIAGMIHRARARAAGRGAAHMVTVSPGAGRGQFVLFEALDGTTA